ncbi:hypothetical protein BXY82_1749 [Gelidibacter sediminis]|uniref:YVTN family beta-propeller protein n=1 Tax=Gelidibacter sediminis TaxID=1608710 RepID=A0A4R7PZK6_9FLAO|nr:DUF5074 domain-containing protein [Gelidibacter sediminis]TDU39719.1 hypothetical protein BXY82_1749 [Gelidibacter sediminis]
MKIKKHLILGLSLVMLAFSCSNDNDNIQTEASGAYEDGILITNEGNYSQGNGSVSFVSTDFSYAENTIFSNVNGKLLGDTVQSIEFYEDLAFIIVNNSQKIEVVNRYTFKSVATIDSGLNNPRYMTVLLGKGYVTNWGDGSDPSDDYVAVIDLNTFAITTTISVEEGPERIVSNATTAYVAHKGGYGQNNIVSVIDANATVLKTITVGDVPNSMAFDNLGQLYVLAEGKPSWTQDETAGKLSVIDPTNNTVISSLDFAIDQHPTNLTYGESLYYYMSGKVYKYDVDSTNLPSTAVIEGVNFNYMTVNNGVLYGVDAGDYTNNGIFKSYDLATYTAKNSKEVGIIPGGIYFNN